MLEELFDSQTECLELFLLHPEGDEIEANSRDQAEATLPWFTDSFRLEDGKFLVFVSFDHLRLHLTADRCYEDTLAGTGSGRRLHGEVGDGCGRGGRMIASPGVVLRITLDAWNRFHYTQKEETSSSKMFRKFPGK